MKRFIVFFVFVASIYFSTNANLLYDITDGKFRASEQFSPVSMNDGEHYTLMIENRAVVKYNYRTGATVDTIFSISQIKNCPVKSISGYELSPNELKLLVYTNPQKRYRRTFTAEYYVVDIERKEMIPLSDYGRQEAPLFSPDSRYIAFARDNNLFMRKLDFNSELAITKDGEAGKIINGIPDWVYEKEFRATRYFEWSPDSKMIAFLKFDESDVKTYQMQLFTSPGNLEDELLLYPNFFEYKYPKAGEKVSKVTLCVYEDFYKSTKVMDLKPENDIFYIPRIKWTNTNDRLAVFTLNRNQNKLNMYFANPKSTVSTLVFQQNDLAYVDYENIDFCYFLKDNASFITLDEKDGYRHVYQYSMSGLVLNQLTKGYWDVTKVYGYDENKKLLYYQSAETSPTQRNVYAIDSRGRKTLLTDGKGTHNASFNSKFDLFIDHASSVEKPLSSTLRNANGRSIRALVSNNDLLEKAQSYNLPQKEFFSFTTSENILLNGWMLKPTSMDASKKYPVLMIQYGGPDSQLALDRWDIGWEHHLVQKGYIVVCVDGRGTGTRGSEFRKCTYQQLGKIEAKDQIETAKYLAKQSFVDAGRIGIWGWSYGGFMTLTAMSTGEKIFKTGIAVAPVTDWRLYDATYTERFMKRPEENFSGYEAISPILSADKLEGKLLIIHGTADDNVHVQNTLLYANRLVEADKQFEMHLYTDKNHSILGKQTRRHLYTRMSNFLFDNL